MIVLIYFLFLKVLTKIDIDISKYLHLIAQECDTDNDCRKQNPEKPYCAERCTKLEESTPAENPKCVGGSKYDQNFCKSRILYHFKVIFGKLPLKFSTFSTYRIKQF